MDKGGYREELRALEESSKPINEAIARQSVKSEDVKEAIEQLMSEYVDDFEGYPASCGKWNRNIDLAIAALQDYQPWIPVSERLPTEEDADRCGRIQVCWDSGLVDVWNPIMLEHHVTKRYDGALTKVTHWKPLPEPPKGEAP